MDTKKILIKVDADESVLKRLLQSYEAEFSAITKKKPNSEGVFELDFKLNNKNLAFLLISEGLPAGFIVISTLVNYEVLEFYILPCFRQDGLGRWMFTEILKKFKGKWTIKQLKKANGAKRFWIKVLEGLFGNNFDSSELKDDYWGDVYVQKFNNE